MLSKQEDDLLLCLSKEEYISQRSLSETTGYSLGTINKTIKALVDNGYLDDGNRITSKARSVIKDKSPRNAIILAAGFGMRMVPINMSAPKALIEVDGERLIERTIRQLHEVGIKEIYVVVGYMKEQFEYLIDDYGVKLIVNSQYSQKNNLHSLNLASTHLSNTYIVPCDIWCRNNPFSKEELYSWYMVSDLVDDESEVRVNRKMELSVVEKNTAGNQMIGISYITDDLAKVLVERLATCDEDKRFDSEFWEKSAYANEKMLFQARVVHANDYVEINTYEQLRELDENSNQLRTDAIKIIAKEFKVKEDEIKNISILKKGMTNRSFLFTCKGSKYIMRIPGEGTDQLIDREAEASVYEKIRGCMFCDDPVYINPQNGYKITKYIEGVRCCNPEDETDLRICMKKLRRFHDYSVNGKPLTTNKVFDLKERLEFYEKLWDGKPSIYRDYLITKNNCYKLFPFINQHRGELQLTHIDAVPDNFLFDPNTNGELEVQLTDWEYASMQDKHVDIAMFCIYAMYEKEQIDHLIDIYFESEGGCDIPTRAKIYAYISICGLIWSNWCEYKRNLGVEFGEYSIRQYRYGKEYYRYARDLIERIKE